MKKTELNKLMKRIETNLPCLMLVNKINNVSEFINNAKYKKIFEDWFGVPFDLTLLPIHDHLCKVGEVQKWLGFEMHIEEEMNKLRTNPQQLMKLFFKNFIPQMSNGI